MNIGTKYLLPKQMKNAGLKDGELSVSETAIRDIVRYFTREAGVRALERELSKICRKAVKQLLTEKQAGDAEAHRVTATPTKLRQPPAGRKHRLGKAATKKQAGR